MEEHYHHFGHCKTINVKYGQWVKKGQKIATVGNTGHSTSAHLHWEIQLLLRPTWTTYTTGLTKDGVSKIYLNPAEIISAGGVLPLAGGKVTGWGWLEWNGSQFHPGWDLNVGSGNYDEGMDILAPEDGTIIFTGFDNGWGNHLFLKSNDKLMIELIDQLRKDHDDFVKSTWKRLDAIEEAVKSIAKLDRKQKANIKKVKKVNKKQNKKLANIFNKLTK